MDTFEAKAIQFSLPNGRKSEVTTELPGSMKPQYDLMIKTGCRIETEILGTGVVATTISDAETDHYIEITPNGPAVKEAVIKMLTQFDPETITIEPL